MKRLCNLESGAGGGSTALKEGQQSLGWEGSMGGDGRGIGSQVGEEKTIGWGA